VHADRTAALALEIDDPVPDRGRPSGVTILGWTTSYLTDTRQNRQAGALFGTRLQRANVTDAADARQVAKEERDRAQSADKDAQAGRATVAVVRPRPRHTWAGPPGPERPSRRRRGGNQADRSDQDLRELAELVRLMMPGI
jgi:hypothetical protein